MDHRSRGTFSSWLLNALFEPIDIAWLVAFRIGFGLLLLFEAGRYLALGWVHSHYVLPSFHFTYEGFDWVRPWPGYGMYVHFAALGVLGLAIAAGAFYRIATPLFALGFSYVFLLDKAEYLNHFYLIALVSWALCFLPAHRACSVDAWRDPGSSAGTTPAWTLWLIRFHVAIPYFFGGVAKIDRDWLAGEPMRTWLSEWIHLPLLGPQCTDERVVYFFAIGGLVFDLAIIPLLLGRRTRGLGMVLMLSFHLTNATVFRIGVFPWMMIWATLVFLDPDWPRRFIPAPGETRDAAPGAPPPGGWSRRRVALAAALGAYVTFHLLFPLRHLCYPGPVHWTEEGHRFAWHMLARTKSGETSFTLTDPKTGRWLTVSPLEILSPRQAENMAGRPDMILQFAHHLADLARQRGLGDVQVRVRAMVSLNGRRPQFLIDPAVDLARVPRAGSHLWWVVPLHEPLPGAAPGQRTPGPSARPSIAAGAKGQ